MAYRLNDFQDGDTVDLLRVNEEAVDLYRRAQEVIDRRYVHFAFMLHAGPIATGMSAQELRMEVRSPFKWDITFVEMYATDAAGSASQVLTVDTTVDPDGTPISLRQVSLTMESDTDTVTPFYSDSVSTVQHVPANTVVRWDFASDGGAVDDSWCIVHGRYDMHDGITIAEPPQVRGGETIEATEWDDWFTSVNTSLGLAQVARQKRKHIEVWNLRAWDASTSGTQYIFGPGRGTATTGGTLTAADVYMASSAGSKVETVVLEDYENGTPTTMFTEAAQGDGSNLTRNAATISSADTQSDSSDPADITDRIQIKTSADATAGTIYRSYAVLFWES